MTLYNGQAWGFIDPPHETGTHCIPRDRRATLARLETHVRCLALLVGLQ